MKTIKISTQQKFDYAILQIELNQFEQKRERVELFKKIEKTKTIKIVEFFENKLVSLINRIIIDEFSKKILQNNEFEEIQKRNITRF
jgi:hypothetical protein